MRSADSKEARFTEAKPKLGRWDKHFIEQAYVASKMSKDPSTKVGSVIVNNRRIVGTGYNGFPRFIQDDARLDNRETKYPMIIHAEMNALLDAGREAMGATLYLYGFASAPCTNCTKHLIQAGIARVVSYGQEVPDRWLKDFELAEQMLGEANIIVDTHPGCVPPHLL